MTAEEKQAFLQMLDRMVQSVENDAPIVKLNRNAAKLLADSQTANNPIPYLVAAAREMDYAPAMAKTNAALLDTYRTAIERLKSMPAEEITVELIESLIVPR